jgi:predicted negative regulator of RcsB-dependent stress response
MSAGLFFTLIVLIILGYSYNHILVKIINNIETLKNITKTHINQILTIILISIILIAGFAPNSTKKKFSSISKNYENIRTPASQKRPNPLFDINTYW